jgi:hypothetical protein
VTRCGKRRPVRPVSELPQNTVAFKRMWILSTTSTGEMGCKLCNTKELRCERNGYLRYPFLHRISAYTEPRVLRRQVAKSGRSQWPADCSVFGEHPKTECFAGEFISMSKMLRFAIFAACLMCVGKIFAQGACPANAPVTGNNCYYIAANGSDSNSGTTESTPWQHAPGMSSCAGKCAAVTPRAGEGFLFRGGDTWHFGNSAATPHTGGTWTWTWSGSSANCDTTDASSPVETSCVYVGVDKSWYGGSSWARPILTGDNPTSTTSVASCAYPNVGSKNDLLAVNNTGWTVFDNFEFTGMCQQTASSSGNGYLFDWNLYIQEANANPGGHIVQNRYENIYSHGWTHLAFSCSDSGGEPVGQCFSEGFIGGGGLGSTVGPGNVCDGWDSDPTGLGCIILNPGYLVYANVFEHQAQIVVNEYHDWHDNVWQNYYPTGDGVAHGNAFEANSDAPGCDADGNCQPITPFNVFYNNVMGHNSTGTFGTVKLWFCPNSSAAEYQFNNIIYDQGGANNWDFATGGFNCTASNAGIYLFNNTVDLPFGSTINCVGNEIATNNHIITDSGTGFGSGPCTISNSTVMSHIAAIADGYMAAGTGTSGNNNNITCADDTAPCSPVSGSAPTAVAIGANKQAYCSALLNSSEPMIQRAGLACQHGTTAGCVYDTSTRSVTCRPAQAEVGRPLSGNWNSGSYQFSGEGSPIKLTGAVK